MNHEMHRLNLHISHQQHQKIHGMAQAMGVSFAEMVRRLLDEALLYTKTPQAPASQEDA